MALKAHRHVFGQKVNPRFFLSVNLKIIMGGNICTSFKVFRCVFLETMKIKVIASFLIWTSVFHIMNG